jgi:hypothetical protein
VASALFRVNPVPLACWCKVEVMIVIPFLWAGSRPSPRHSYFIGRGDGQGAFLMGCCPHDQPPFPKTLDWQ